MATLSEQIERLAAALGARSIHLVYLHQGGQWLVIAMWNEDELVRFGNRDTAEEAIEAAMEGSRGDE